MNIVFLEDHINVVIEECLKRNQTGYEYDITVLKQAIDAHVNTNLRYHKRSGKVYNRNGELSAYVHKTDIPNYSSDIDCAVWEFSGIVRNSANRIFKGLEPI
jgi:hypothetical protein